MRLVKPSFEIMAAYGHDHLPYSYDRPHELIEAAGRACYQSEDKAWGVCPECNGAGWWMSPNTPCHICEGGKYKTSVDKFVEMLRKRGHRAMLEHSWEIRRWYGLFSSTPATKFLNLCVEDSLIAGNARAWEESGLRAGTVLVENLLNVPRSFAIRPEIFAMTARIVCDRGVSHGIVRHRVAGYAQESTRYCNYSLGGFGGGIATIKPFFFDPHEPGLRDKEIARRAASLGVWQRAMEAAEEAYLELISLGATPQEARSVLPNSLKTTLIITASLKEWQHIFKLRCDKAAHPQVREIMVPLRDAARKLYPEVF